MIFVVFETLINIFQSVAVSIFLMKILDVKNANQKKQVFTLAIIITFVYLEISNYLVFFESVGIIIYLALSLMFSFTYLSGTSAEKIFYNILMLFSIAGSSLLGGGIVSLAIQRDYLNTVAFYTCRRYVVAILVQILMILLFWFIIRMKSILELSDQKFAFITAAIPAVSLVVCCLMVFRNDRSYEINVLYTYIAVIGVIIINFISIILLKMEQTIYKKQINQELVLAAYKQREKDIESILELQRQYNKQKHEMKNIIVLFKELFRDGNSSKAKEILKRYEERYEKTNITEVICENVVINYLLHRKLNQCKMFNIPMSCFVMGNICGIDDLDMYILLENLCDNAIEAAIKSEKPEIDLQIASDIGNHCIDIELGNSIQENVLIKNPNMNTTKKDSNIHGFGLMNIREVVEKYNGTILYEQRGSTYVVCKVRLHS